MKKLVCLIALAVLPLGYVVADCIGNTNSSVECGGEPVGWLYNGDPSDFSSPGETWCCTPVGDGSDYSCTNGESWELSSELGCGTPTLH